MPVDWRRFSEELTEWEQTSSHERFAALCKAIERAVRRALKKDPLLDLGEATAALDAVAAELVRTRRELEGRRPVIRVPVELDKAAAERLRLVAFSEGIEVGELAAALLDSRLRIAEPIRGSREARRAKRRAGGAD